jgi:hypothetical protein
MHPSACGASRRKPCTVAFPTFMRRSIISSAITESGLPDFWCSCAAGVSGTLACSLSLEPLARFVTGGAGARPDHPIIGRKYKLANARYWMTSTNQKSVAPTRGACSSWKMTEGTLRNG